MKRYKIRNKRNKLFSFGHGDWECDSEEGKLYDSIRSARQGLSYAITEGKRVCKNSLKGLGWKTVSERDARRFLDLVEKKEIKKDYEIVEYELVESSVYEV